MNRRIQSVLMLLSILIAVTWGCARSPSSGVRTEAGSSSASVDGASEGGAHDGFITVRIKTAYLFNPHLSATGIHVTTRDGEVTLSGSVPSDVHRDLAGAIARNAEGVRKVHNDLRVDADARQEPDPTERTFGEAVHDATITASVKLGLAFGRGVHASEINVDTREGTVTLRGEVGSQAERQLAARIARDTDGVKKVVNEIEVRG